jgi:type III restriction enzyme
VVVEIKDDELIGKVKESGDIAKENKAKYKYAIEHFNRLNVLQKDQKYYFTFLTPNDFDNFFGILRSSDFSGFKSQLDIELEDE